MNINYGMLARLSCCMRALEFTSGKFTQLFIILIKVFHKRINYNSQKFPQWCAKCHPILS